MRHEVVPGLAYETTSCARCGKLFLYRIAGVTESPRHDFPAFSSEPTPSQMVDALLRDLGLS